MEKFLVHLIINKIIEKPKQTIRGDVVYVKNAIPERYDGFFVVVYEVSE